MHAYAAAHDGQEPGDGFCDPMALTSVDQRLRTLENLGVDHVLIVRYTLAFATKSYRFFLGQMVGNNLLNACGGSLGVDLTDNSHN